jgi:hypothetical protein
MFTVSFAGEPVARRLYMRAMLVALLTLVTFTCLPARASAVTIDQVVALSKAGVSEAVILALIDRDKTIFNIEPEQLVSLKQQGLSEPIILAMLRSGRAEGEQAAQAEASSRAAMILAGLSTAPEVAIVGHGPDTPNTTHFGYSYYPGYDFPATGYGAAVVPIPVPYPTAPIALRRTEVHRERDRMFCLAQTTGRGGPGGPVASWVTECPPVMQRAFRRTTR